MKSKIKHLTFVLIAALVGLVEVANAFYDPGLQRWINRDPLGDIASLPVLRAAFPSRLESVGDEENSDAEDFDVGVQTQANSFAGINNNPLGIVDLFGLSGCHIWDIHDEKDPDPNLAEINKRLNKQADEKIAQMQADDAKMKIAIAKTVGIAAAGEVLGAEMAAAKIGPKIGQKLFGGGGWLNSNRYLRVGMSRDGGRKVFRIAGDWIGKIKKDPHIVIKDCGPL